MTTREQLETRIVELNAETCNYTAAIREAEAALRTEHDKAECEEIATAISEIGGLMAIAAASINETLDEIESAES